MAVYTIDRHRTVLSGNQIVALESGGFGGLWKLIELGLNVNQIASLDKGDFESLGELREIDLPGDELTELNRIGAPLEHLTTQFQNAQRSGSDTLSG